MRAWAEHDAHVATYSHWVSRHMRKLNVPTEVKVAMMIALPWEVIRAICDCVGAAVETQDLMRRMGGPLSPPGGDQRSQKPHLGAP